MSTEKADFPYPEKLERRRPSYTCQGVIFRNLSNHTPYMTYIKDRGDSIGRGGKPALTGIFGGGGETVVTAEIDGKAHHGLTEHDLCVREKNRGGWKFTVLSVGGEPVEGKNTFSARLRDYPVPDQGEAGVRIPVSVLRDGTEETIVVIPEREETPGETMYREALNEVGYQTAIIPPKNGEAYFMTTVRKFSHLNETFAPSLHGEWLRQTEKDFFNHPAGHTVYTYFLEIIGGSPDLPEHGEVYGIHTIPFKEIVEKIVSYPFASHINPNGFSFKHCVRIFNMWWIYNGCNMDMECFRPFFPTDPTVYSGDFARSDELQKFMPEDLWKKVFGYEASKPDDGNGAPSSLATAVRSAEDAAWAEWGEKASEEWEASKLSLSRKH